MRVGYNPYDADDDGLDVSAEELLEMLCRPDCDDADRDDAKAAWRPRLSAVERAQQLADAIGSTEVGAHRVEGIGMLAGLGETVAEPHMWALLDTPASGHAAMWLIDHGLVDEDTIGPRISTGVLIDILSAIMREPKTFTHLFEFNVREDGELLDEMWRHDAPETAVVLEALGEQLADQPLARAVRKALFQHLSWKAGLHR